MTKKKNMLELLKVGRKQLIVINKYIKEVYSLRYKNSDDDVIQFKFVCDLV